MAAQSPAERLAVALMLGDADVRVLATAKGVSDEEARNIIARGRRRGRVASVANAALP